MGGDAARHLLVERLGGGDKEDAAPPIARGRETEGLRAFAGANASEK
jgi:hypothetical protein